MATNANSSVNWDNVEILAQNATENKEVLIDDVDNKTYVIHDYIPKRITKSFLKPSYIVITTLILILIIIIGIISHDNNDFPSQYNNLAVTSITLDTSSTKLIESTTDLQDKDEKTHNAIDEELTTVDSTTYEPSEKEMDTSDEIIFCEENKIWLYKINSQKSTLLYQSEHTIKAVEIDSNKTIFFSKENMIYSLSAKENQTKINVNLIFEDSRVNPKDMAMDFINNNLYIVDESMGSLIVINTQTKYYSLLLMNLNSPRSIVMDPPKGILFIVTADAIMKGNMDGTSMQTILPMQLHRGAIALDKIGEKIYWIQDFENIMTSNYDGSGERNILSDHTTISELMVLGDRLFWLRIVDGLKTKLWSCWINKDNCNAHSRNNIEPLANPKLMRGVSQSDNTLKYTNTLVRRCEHISLAMPDGQISCTCNMGSHLVYNTSCEPYREFGLYTLNRTIRARFLYTFSELSVEYIWPTPYSVESLTCKGVIDFDYDLKNDHFYFSDDKNIYKINIKEKNWRQTVIMTELVTRCIEYLVYDWLTGNMYYLSSSKGIGDYYIGVLNIRNNVIKTNLVSFSCDASHRFDGCSFGLAISPIRGYLFFSSSINNDTLRLNRWTINSGKVDGIRDLNFIDEDDRSSQYNDYNSEYENDGMNKKYVYFNDKQPLFTVDYIKNKLYYIFSTSQFELYHVNFDGTDPTYVNNVLAINIRSLSVHKQWIYFNDDKGVWKSRKERSEQIHMMQVNDPSQESFGKFKVISQPEDNKNPCRNNNGGCEQFCFIGPKPICNCKDNYTLTLDGKCLQP